MLAWWERTLTKLRHRWIWLISLPIVGFVWWLIEPVVQGFVWKYLPQVAQTIWDAAPAFVKWIGANPLLATSVGFFIMLSILLLISFWQTRPDRGHALRKLNDLWTEGVDKMNEPLLTPAHVVRWVSDIQAWHQIVIQTVELLNPDEAGTIRTLGLFRSVDIKNPINDDHARFFRIHTARLDNLKALIQKYQGPND